MIIGEIMGENFSFLAQPLKASKIINDGTLSVTALKVDTLDELTAEHGIEALNPITGSGTSLALDNLTVDTIQAKDAYGVTVNPTLTSGTTYTLWSKPAEVTGDGETPNGTVVALIDLPTWALPGGVIKFTCDIKNSDVANQYAYVKVLEVADFPTMGENIAFAGYIGSVQQASINIYTSKTFDVIIGATLRKWAVLIHSEAGITGLACIKNLVLSCSVSGYTMTVGAAPFTGCS